MKLIIFFTAFFLMSCSNILAQMSGGFDGSRQNIVNLNQMIGLPTDALGKDPYIDIEGTPFLYVFFTDCVIQFFDGKSFKGPKMKFNLTNQKFHYLGARDEEFVAQDGTIKRFSFVVPSGSDSISYTFGCGYPSVGINTFYTFYQEYNVGTATFLRFINKSVVERKTLATINPVKQFSEESSYFVYNAHYKKMERWRKGKEFLLEILFDRQELVNNYINKNNISCKSVQDVIKIIQFYNNLKAE